MKKTITIFLFLFSCAAYGQKISAYGMDKVRIIAGEKIIVAEIIPVSSEPRIKTACFYYWYSGNAIHSSQGGYSGRLLNGRYNEYYLNNNLKEQGNFNKGLKDGLWKSWNESGALSQVSNWKNGAILPDSTRSFWYKLNIFKRKDSLPQTDKAGNKH